MEQNIENSFSDKYLNILEVMIGIDKIDVDDEHFLKGMFRRSKYFLNIKNYRTIQSPLEYY